MKKNAVLAYLGFLILMIALGASDAMRGVFIPIFGEHFDLSNTQRSMIITVSYVGNLVFLLFGGRLADTRHRKLAFFGAAALWMGAVVSYIFSDSYVALLVGMFFSMGASTLTSTLINVLTGQIFIGMSAVVVNTLFFIQGIGTTGSQRLAGMFADGFSSWHWANAILLVMGLAGAAVLIFVRFPRPGSDGAEPSEKFGFRKVLKNRAFYFLVLMLGLYFIAEHSVMNWLVTTGTGAFGLTIDEASGYLSLFFGGIMAGRLVFAPVVQKFGIKRSIMAFTTAATVLFVIATVMQQRGLLLLGISGLFFSILYPTMVMLIQSYYPAGGVATAAGMIISAATLFDIGWNAVYGSLMDLIGMQNAYLLQGAAMILFFLCCAGLLDIRKVWKRRE